MASDVAFDERPAKRIKIDDAIAAEGKREQHVETAPARLVSDGRSGENPASLQRGKRTKHGFSRPLKSDAGSSSLKTQGERPERVRTFSQPSVITSGDKGIFVTCDKGREKKSLLELHDLTQQYLEEAEVDVSGKPVNGRQHNGDGAERISEEHSGIEVDIASELAAMRNGDTKDTAELSTSKPMQLITLDIPCVSFLRLPPGSTLDPVDIVHKLCLRAADPSTPQQSRYVMRLTPVSNIGKALSQGLERVCEDVLPRYFALRENEAIQDTTFAIRPTIRNNDKLDRDTVIKLVATRVQKLGEQKHKVDLKQYKKGILVEAYRGWVGICVVDNTDTGPYTRAMSS